MTRPETRRASRKKPLGIGVIFVIILFLLNLIGLAAVVASFVTPVSKMVQEALAGVTFRGAPILDRLVEYVTRYLCNPYDRYIVIQDFGAVQSAMIYLSVFYEIMMAFLLFLYFPFAVMGHNRIVNKKGKGWRIVLQVISILLILGLIAFILVVSLHENARFQKPTDWIYTKLWEPWVALFQPNGKLDVLCFTARISTKLFAMGYLALGVVVVSFILNIVGLVGKNNYYGVKVNQLERQPEPYRQLDPLGRRVPAGYGAIKLAPIPSAEHIIVVEPGQKPVLPKSIAPSEPQRKVVPVSYVPSAERATPNDTLPSPKPELVTVSTEDNKPEPKKEPEKVLVPAADRPAVETKPAPEPVKEEPAVEEKPVEEKPLETPVEPIPEIVTPEPEPKTILIKTMPVPEPELVPETKPVAVVKSVPKSPLPETPVEEKKEPKPVVEEKKEPERVWIQPTYREVKILNALEPILPNDTLTLPAIRNTNIEAVLSNLEPFEKEPIESLPSESAEIAEAAKKADTLSPDNVPVDYLPGLDDNIAAPWEEEKEVEKSDVTEAAAPEAVEEPTVEEKTPEVPEEETKEPAPVVEEKVEETAPEAVEETKEPEPEPQPEPEPEPESTAPITATVFPDKEEPEPEPVEEEAETVEEKEEASEEVPAEETAEEVEEKAEEAEEEKEETVEECTPAVTAINHIPEDGLRPQEKDNPDNEVETGPSRYEERVTLCKNSLEAKKETTLTSGWTIPGFEEKEFVAPEEEVKTIVKVVEVPAKEESKPEEKPVEKTQEVPEAPVEETPFEIKPVEPKRSFRLVDPLEHEAASEQAEEKKEISAISGPLHQIRERKRDIQLVAPTKVKFDLKQYKIKTYEGELTPEEAFLKGVTKVQPVVNPVFANQTANDSWKQKKIDEENKKSGYFNVSQGKLVKPTRPLSQKATPTKITSIRDLVKARKAKEKAEEEKKDAE